MAAHQLISPIREIRSPSFAQVRCFLGTTASFEADAARYLRIAADEGSAEAMYELSRLFSAGRGVEKCQSRELLYLRKAAILGYAQAQFEVGASFKAGRGVDESIEQAMRWFRLAAAQGHIVAKFELATMILIYAERGEVDYQVELASIYLHGQGVIPNRETAIRWYETAAKSGHIGRSAPRFSLMFEHHESLSDQFFVVWYFAVCTRSRCCWTLRPAPTKAAAGAQAAA